MIHRRNFRFASLKRMGAARRPGTNGMRALFWTAGLIALAMWLDTSLNGGFYTQAVSQMISDITMHF